MKTFPALYIDTQGVIRYNLFPEEPEYNGEIGHSINVQKEYYSALQAAKDTAVKCADQEQAKKLCWENDRRINNPIPFLWWSENMLKAGDTYPIEGLTFEVKEFSCSHTLKPNELPCPESANEFPDCCGSKQKVAILKLAEKEESQEEIFDDLFSQYFKMLHEGNSMSSTWEVLREKFTITRRK